MHKAVGWNQIGGQGTTCVFFGNVPVNILVSERPSAADVKNLEKYPSYCTDYSDGRLEWREVRSEAAGHLVEVWKLGFLYMAHTSRNRFYWAGTPQLKSFLQLLA